MGNHLLDLLAHKFILSLYRWRNSSFECQERDMVHVLETLQFEEQNLKELALIVFKILDTEEKKLYEWFIRELRSFNDLSKKINEYKKAFFRELNRLLAEEEE